METLRGWILTLTATGLICGAARALSPKGTVRKAVSVVCGFAMMAAVLSVAGNVDALGISRYAARYNSDAALSIDSALEGASKQTRFIIEERTEAYILDKAASLGLALRDVEVTALWSSDGFWYPAHAEMACPEDPELSYALTAELGIPKEEQIWSGEDET